MDHLEIPSKMDLFPNGDVLSGGSNCSSEKRLLCYLIHVGLIYFYSSLA